VGSLSVEYLVANENLQLALSSSSNLELETKEGQKQKRGEPGSTPGPRIFLLKI
jgi:hypothetical protein